MIPVYAPKLPGRAGPVPAADHDRAVVAQVPMAAESMKTCFGVVCPLRQTCLRYLAIDSTPGASTDQGTCCRGGHVYPDYLSALSMETANQLVLQINGAPGEGT